MKPAVSHHSYRVLVFWIGILATIAYRAIIILGRYSTLLVDIAWYVGTIGFLWYFGHRFYVEEKRDLIIEKQQLIKKIDGKKPLTAEDQDALKYILKSLTSSKSRWNYIAIFIASGLALLYDVILRLIK